jgi:hypothetical protein
LRWPPKKNLIINRDVSGGYCKTAVSRWPFSQTKIKMNWKRVKQKWNLAKKLCLVGTSFWIIETSYFLIAYGWHWKAINEAEKMCDNVVGYFWTGGLILTGIVMIDIIEYLLSDSGCS